MIIEGGENHMKPIALSFKNTPEDRELYEWIFSHSNLSGFIKDILRTEMNKENKKRLFKPVSNNYSE